MAAILALICAFVKFGLCNAVLYPRLLEPLGAAATSREERTLGRMEISLYTAARMGKAKKKMRAMTAPLVKAMWGMGDTYLTYEVVCRVLSCECAEAED